MRLAEIRLKTVTSIRGPLIFLEEVPVSKVGEIVSIIAPDGRKTSGEVLKIEEKNVLIQVYGDSSGFDISNTTVTFTDRIKEIPLSERVIGRVFNGNGEPIDGLPDYVPEQFLPVSGLPINPVARAVPQEFIETGFSAIDGLNTLVKGQKLPVFSCAGLPAREMVAFILKNARTSEKNKRFVVIFVAMGLSYHEYAFYKKTMEELKVDFVAFVNLAEDPVMERLLAPRCGLTAA